MPKFSQAEPRGVAQKHPEQKRTLMPEKVSGEECKTEVVAGLRRAGPGSLTPPITAREFKTFACQNRACRHCRAESLYHPEDCFVELRCLYSSYRASSALRSSTV